MIARAEDTATETEIVLTRVFDAPRELVFRAWSDPDWLARWWAPADFTTPHCAVDFRVGGRLHFCFRSPDGREYWGLGVYREIVPPERIVYVDSFSDEEGNLVPPSRYGMSESHPAESLVTVTFDEVDDGTRLIVRHALPAATKERDGALEGWGQMLDKLGAELATGR